MQATLHVPSAPGGVLLFARGGERDYMIRSERRPDGQAPKPPQKRRHRRRRKLDIPYTVFTFLLLIALFPIGLIMLWVRKIPWTGVTKMVITVAFAMVFVLVASFALTVPITDERVAGVQKQAREVVTNAGTNMRESWERLDVTPERVLKNMQDAAGHSVQAAQKGLASVVPVMVENVQHFGSNVTTTATHGKNMLVHQAQELLYMAKLAPTPVPTEEPVPTEAPTIAPAVAPTPTLTPSPTALTAWYVEGDATYHLSNTCAQLRTGDKVSLTISEAVQRGMMPCEVCAVPEVIVTPTPTPTPTPAATVAAIDALENEALSPGTPTNLESVVQPSLDPDSVPTPIVLPPLKPAGEAIVYYTSNGKYYHSGPNCGSMRGAKPHTLQEAVDKGLKRCNGCTPYDSALLEQSRVVWMGDDHLFHVTDECEKMTEKFSLIALSDAMLDAENQGCSACGGDLYQQVAEHEASETPVPVAATVGQ
ncbi:hypothetical protein LJC33_06490 [Eubacteriales bacterium OttesenSCG-928-N13]|nr:hypothetical protein [Eubacteriales bacterium OttesenSCG-928-N13]